MTHDMVEQLSYLICNWKMDYLLIASKKHVNMLASQQIDM